MATETIWYPEEHTAVMASILREGLNTGHVPEELAEILEPQIEEMVEYAERMGLSERHPSEQSVPPGPSIPDIIRRKAEDGNGPDWKDFQ